jgi:A/G-specific adenine glycosylase
LTTGSEGELDLDRAWVKSIRARLVDWYRGGHRDLPWRKDRDAYRILVSEMMLVQTTVTAVVPYYHRFLARFPTARALADADEADVLKAWEGLGYYRRARQLHAAARAIAQEHGGVIPDDPEAVRALPGVGRYIAGAILSFAFDRPAPILEANSQRVIARLLGWKGKLGTTATQGRLWEAAERLVPGTAPGEFNQALMELGATVCIPQDPTCLLCPLARECCARAQGIERLIPVKAAKAPPLAVTEACALVVRDGHLLIVRRAPGRLWEGFWEFPTIHLTGVDPAGRAFADPVELSDGVRRLTGFQIEVGGIAKSVRYSVTKHRVDLTAFAAVAVGGVAEPGPGLDRVVWERPEALGDYPFGSAPRRLATWAATTIANGGWPSDQTAQPHTRQRTQKRGR